MTTLQYNSWRVQINGKLNLCCDQSGKTLRKSQVADHHKGSVHGSNLLYCNECGKMLKMNKPEEHPPLQLQPVNQEGGKGFIHPSQYNGSEQIIWG